MVTKEQTVVETATAMQWFQEFNGFWVAGILPIVLAYFAWRSLKLKVEAENKRRREEFESSGTDEEPGEETIYNYVVNHMKKGKK